METFLGDKFVTHQELRDVNYVNCVELEQVLKDRLSVPMGGGDGDMESRTSTPCLRARNPQAWQSVHKDGEHP